MNDTPQSPPIKGLGKLIHIAGWGILFCSPFFFTGRESQVTFEGYFRSIIVPLSFMLVFYLNYGWLVRRYLFNRRTGRFLLINLLLIGATMLFVHLCMRYFYPPEMHHPARPPRPLNETVGFFLVNAVIYSLVAGLSVAIKMTDGWYRVAAIQRELEKERAEAELQNLKSQLNPHFLFNTLNNIYSLIAFSPEKAQEAVHDLSRLLRYVLYESSQPFVPLEKDFDFLRNYVELMRIRLPKHVELKTNIVASSPGTLIAPLLFMTEKIFGKDKPNVLLYKLFGNKKKTIPFIQKYDVEIQWPKKMYITVYEKPVIGYIRYMGCNMFFDKDGIVVESSTESYDKVPEIIGLKFNSIVLGSKLDVGDDDIFRQILDLTQSFDKYDLDVSKVYFDSSDNLILYIEEVKVYLGNSDDYTDKLFELKQMETKFSGLKGTLYMQDYTKDSNAIIFKKDEK